jgi:hypothetical protein
VRKPTVWRPDVPVRIAAAVLTAIVLITLLPPGGADACGGFFCTTIPVDQSGEKIIFTLDGESITTYVQINYTGRPQDFAWVLPMPSVPKVDTADMATFRDLDRLTTPIYIPPRPPACLPMPQMSAVPAPAAARSSEGGTTVLASGEVGPYGYDVVTSPDPDDLVTWLRNNGYRITDEMVPLVRMYTDDGMIFLAMKLKPGQNTSDVTPVKLTYDASLASVPLRLTAVAATPDMPVTVWLFAKDQAAPLNYVPITVADSEVKFTPFGQNDYQQTVSRVVDQAGGRAFITELAQPTSALRPPSDPTATLLMQQYPYVTRLFTRISPDEMTIDPVFDVSPGLPNVSNVHDLSNKPTPWQCTDNFSTWRSVGSAGPPPTLLAGKRYVQSLGYGGVPKGWAFFAIVAATLLVVWKRRPALAATARASETGRAGLRRLAQRLIPRVSREGVALLFLEMMILQGVHEMEHIVQVVQRTALGISKGAGMLGSVFDIEPVHMVYNVGFLVLLGLVYQGCRHDVRAIPRRADLVMRLLQVSFVFQIWHSIEHVVKMWQYIETGLNGTPGILGYWIPVVYLHLSYNTLLYAPIVVAFFAGGLHLASAKVVRGMLHGRRASGPRLAS